MPFRPLLRPGAPLLRRDASHLQVGTAPGIVVSDRPGLMTLLLLLDGRHDVGHLERLVGAEAPEMNGSVAAVLAELRALGAVVDAEALHPGARRLASYEVGWHHDYASTALADAAASILVASGVRHLSLSDPDLLVIVSCGEPSRTLFERPALLGLDHLPVVLDEDRVRIGPLVRPGSSPCVSCHDRHRADWDRAWPAMLPQLGRGSARVTRGAVGPLTTHAAAVEVAAEVLAHAEGRRTPTTGGCLVVGPGHDERATWPVAFHHGCACDLLNAA